MLLVVSFFVGGVHYVMAKSFSFMDDPCAPGRIGGTAIVFKMLEDFSNFAGMIISIAVLKLPILSSKQLAGGIKATRKGFRQSSLCSVGSWLESPQDAREYIGICQRAR
jgi:hypothetical protein